MNLITIITFLIANKQAIVELIKLIQELADMFSGNTAFVMSDELVSTCEEKSPVLSAAANAAGMSFGDLLKFLIENKDAILELIKLFTDLFSKKS